MKKLVLAMVLMAVLVLGIGTATATPYTGRSGHTPCGWMGWSGMKMWTSMYTGSSGYTTCGWMGRSQWHNSDD